MSEYDIEIKGARANNLKNISIDLPRGKFIVVTGVSGSGKSSLAFDTLFAEGRRRYVESLSAYARQFLGRIPKPECDYIKGLPPAIAIEQKTASHNPRSTVGTATEIDDYLRLLFARVGHTFSPVSGQEVKKNSIDDIVDTLMALPEGTRYAILAPLRIPEGRTFEQQLDVYRKVGFSRLEKNGDFIDISELLESKAPLAPEYYNLLIDRLVAGSDDKDTRARIADSLETAYFEGHDECIVKVWDSPEPRSLVFSKKFTADGILFREPTESMFNFNNPYGACPTCQGFGNVMGISEDLVVPNKSKSVYQDAVVCWNGPKSSLFKKDFIHYAAMRHFPIHKPYNELSQKEIDFLWKGDKSIGWAGINGFFDFVDKNQYKIHYRVLKARFKGKTRCPDCLGMRLRYDAQYVKIGGKSIGELYGMPISGLRQFFDYLDLSGHEYAIAKRLLVEIRNRLRFLDEVGLGYLTLSRRWSTLSGGESQRIKLATSLGSSLVGSLYVLDEPSIGLHPRDTQRLLSILKSLRDVGNTVVVVEHDEEIMRGADYLVDIGPDAGRNGGTVVFEGSVDEAQTSEASAKYPLSKTVSYLSGARKIDMPSLRRPWKTKVRVEGASENNLKKIDVDFPLGVLTVVTGVSGSGKSTLVRDILYKGLARKLNVSNEQPGAHAAITGNHDLIRNISYITQNPVGTSTRSNAATFLKIFDEVRKLYSSQPLAKQMGYTPGFFSFNSEGGRCEECKGEGVITVPMQFMADIQIPCEVCKGKRFKPEILDIKFHDKSISDILEMSAQQAFDFFSEVEQTAAVKQIVANIRPLLEVGLGYLPLGQPSSTLSGGENQRLKLAYLLSPVFKRENPLHTDDGKWNDMYILDEPTTGLHTADISTLLNALNQIVARGDTVIIIEHNMHIAKAADWIIDMGPEGGEEGGYVVAQGTPEDIVSNENSVTARYLKEEMER